MKPHDPISTPASSGRHPEAVRGSDAQVCLPLWAARIAYVEIFAVMDLATEPSFHVVCSPMMDVGGRGGNAAASIAGEPV